MYQEFPKSSLQDFLTKVAAQCQKLKASSVQSKALGGAGAGSGSRERPIDMAGKICLHVRSGYLKPFRFQFDSVLNVGSAGQMTMPR